MLDTVLFAIFPYVAVILAVVMGVYRYVQDPFSQSSFSSQLLENRRLFWGSVGWHYAILIILLAHLLGFLFPAWWAEVIANPLRLYPLEIIGLALALLAVTALLVLTIRRLRYRRAWTVTSAMDWLLLALLLTQVSLGFWVALVYRWGAEWYLFTAVPWLMSLFAFNPNPEFVVSLPWVVKLHFLGGFVLLAVFPFTRLMHLVAFPLGYLWRPHQLVIWHRSPRRAAP